MYHLSFPVVPRSVYRQPLLPRSVEEERKNISKRIKDGIAASEKKTGECRKGKVFKLDDVLKEDIKKYLKDRTIKKSDLLKNRKMSPNTLDKYIKIVKEEMEEAPEN